MVDLLRSRARFFVIGVVFLIPVMLTVLLMVRAVQDGLRVSVTNLSSTVDPDRTIYLSVSLQHQGPLPVSIDAIDILETERSTYRPALFVSPGGGISYDPFPGMQPISWPLRVARGTTLNPVFVFKPGEHLGQIGQIRYQTRVLGWRLEHIDAINYSFSAQPVD